jgi:hypothetical protein
LNDEIKKRIYEFMGQKNKQNVKRRKKKKEMRVYEG